LIEKAQATEPTDFELACEIQGAAELLTDSAFAQLCARFVEEYAPSSTPDKCTCATPAPISETTGAISFVDGEPWDNIKEITVCKSCGKLID
jgi:hypothetical protein